MIRSIVLFTVIFLIGAGTSSLHAQEGSTLDGVAGVPAINTIYFELWGPAILYSVNYDRMFTKNISGRIGLSYLGYSFTSDSYEEDPDGGPALAGTDLSFDLFFIPILGNYTIGEGSSKLEIGLGGTVVVGSFELDTGSDFPFKEFLNTLDGTVLGAFTVGYRYQPPEGGFNFRVGLDALIGGGGVLPNSHISFGHSF